MQSPRREAVDVEQQPLRGAESGDRRLNALQSLSTRAQVLLAVVVALVFGGLVALIVSASRGEAEASSGARDPSSGGNVPLAPAPPPPWPP